MQSKIAVVKTEMNDVVKRMSRAGSREVSRKVSGLNLGSDFDRIMPHAQTEMETFRQDLEIAMQKIGQAINDDVFYMKTTGKVAE